MALLLPWVVLVATVAMSVALLRSRGADGRVITPIVLFMLIDLTVTWPAMLPTSSSVLTQSDGWLAVLVTIGMLLSVVCFVLAGGLRAPVLQWRGDELQPDSAVVRRLGWGLAALVSVLVGLALLRFQGLPPMLSGGFSSLLDPVGHSEQAAAIRETRRSLTKGAVLLGDQYRGQGFLNQFTHAGWMVAIATSVLYWSWRRTRGAAVQVAVVGLTCFVFLGSAGSRGPLLFVAFCGLVAWSLRHRATTRHLVIAVVSFVGLLLLIMPLSKGERGGSDVASRAEASWTRVTDGNGRNSAHIVNLVDSGRLAPSHGRLFLERAAAALPGVRDQQPFAHRLNMMVNGERRQSTGYLTATQFGLLYAEGGELAVLLGYALTGLAIALLWRIILRLRSAVGAVITAVAVVVIGNIAITGFPGMVATGAVVALAAGIIVAPESLHRLTRHSVPIRERTPGNLT